MKCELQESAGELHKYLPAETDPPGSVHPLTRVPDPRSVTSHSSTLSPPSSGSAGGVQHRADGRRVVLIFRSHLCEIAVMQCRESVPRKVSALLSAVESVGRPAHESASLREIRRFGVRRLHRQHAGIPTAHCRVLTPTVRPHSLMGSCPEVVPCRSVDHWTGKGDLE